MFHGGLFDENRGAAKRPVIESPRLRVTVVLLTIAAASSFPSVWISAAALLGFLLLLLRSGMPPKYVLIRALFIVPFGLSASVLLPMSFPGVIGWQKAGLLIMKLLCANLGLTYLLGTTAVPQLLKTLRTMKVPIPLLDMIGFTLRYVSVLAEEAAAMLVAQRSRGMRAASWARPRSYRRIGQLLGGLLIRSLERSERIHQAMLARGYDNAQTMQKPAGGENDGCRTHRKLMLSLSGFDPSASGRQLSHSRGR